MADNVLNQRSTSHSLVIVVQSRVLMFLPSPLSIVAFLSLSLSEIFLVVSFFFSPRPPLEPSGGGDGRTDRADRAVPLLDLKAGLLHAAAAALRRCAGQAAHGARQRLQCKSVRTNDRGTTDRASLKPANVVPRPRDSPASRGFLGPENAPSPVRHSTAQD